MGKSSPELVRFEFGLLGPLQVRLSGAAFALGSSRQRALLALLLLHIGEPVSTERLVDAIWGETTPSSAAKMVHLFISRLRKQLMGVGAPEIIRTTPVGYVLAIDPQSLDVNRFDQLVRSGREALHDDPRAAAALLHQALELWRGPALVDLLDVRVFASEAARLEEQRITVAEDLAEAELALGHHAKLVSELEALVTANPLRERLRGQLMLALYRCGRQAEALAAYRETRDTLVNELGIEPGKSLQQLHTAILQQDAVLDLPDAADALKTVPPAAALVIRRRTRRHGLRGPIALTAVVATIGAAVGFYAVLTRSAPLIVHPNTVGVFDPASGRLIADPLVGKSPGPLVASAGGIWVANQADRTVVRLDPGSRRITTTFGVPAVPTALAAGTAEVWVADGYTGTVSRIRTGPAFLSSPFRPEPGVRGRVLLSISGGALWAALTDGSVIELDPASLRAVQSFTGGRLPGALLAADGYIWETADVGGGLRRFTSAVGSRSLRIALGAVTALAYGDGSLWAGAGDRIWRIAPRSGRILASVPAPGTTSIAVAGGSVWGASEGAGTLYQIDARSNELVRTRRLGHQLGDVAFARGHLWVAISA